ncbi:Porin [uncultured Defluviicoccus sp.]|uniref:Porin n=1 Tax=metagenome TaxID=256318 RepID=A0A380T9B2_9ZZZZ|nr:Porin [uncultured Defluviicoccus sp.]
MNPRMFVSTHAIACALFSLGLVAMRASPAMAQEPPAQEAEGGDDAIVFGLTYKADISGVLAGGDSKAGRLLDNLEATAEISLEDLFGWTGGKVYGHLLSNSGRAPNDIAGTLQGVDNIEVARPRAKVYQLWFEQAFADGRGSVLTGLYDLNSEFYQTETAGLLIAPAFGIGSELAATGPNGPSIFPSTALALRGRWEVTEGNEIQGAVLNASAGVLGDPGGVDLSFDNGALLIGEWVHSGDVTVRFGAWGYTDDQDDIRDVDTFGAPLLRKAHGVYASVEGEIAKFGGSTVSAFVRAGTSEGHTTPYAGGWQAGMLVLAPFESRPDSSFSFGLNQGLTNSRERANFRDAGGTPSTGESAIEITYADKITENLTLQPDLQFIRDPGADKGRDDVVVATLRATLEY